MCWHKICYPLILRLGGNCQYEIYTIMVLCFRYSHLEFWVYGNKGGDDPCEMDSQRGLHNNKDGDEGDRESGEGGC